MRMRLLGLILLGFMGVSGWAEGLPWSTVFRGEDQFRRLLEQAKKEQWSRLPFGERVGIVGLALRRTPYQSFTLEIDDHIEAASVNFEGMDCWTFFETALAFARLLEWDEVDRTSQRLLNLIEKDRYRGGKCTGGYLSRFHFLEEWAADNERRGLVKNLTRELGGVRMPSRTIREMSHGWRSYRYLKCNPSLRAPMAQLEKEVSALAVYHIPKSEVGSVEKSIQTGDVICISTKDSSSYTSHVGLAFRDSKNVVHFLHATSQRSKGRMVVLDERLQEYLMANRLHAGIYVVRPHAVPKK